MSGVRGGRVTSIKNLKSSLKKSSGGGIIKYIPAGEGVMVRFLTEPEEWVEWFEHYEDGKGSYPCTGDACDGCANGVRVSKRFLAAAVDVNDGNKVIALQLPVTAAKALTKKYDRYQTITDRDYELSKEGEGLNTEYNVESEAPTRFNASRYEAPDLMEILNSMAGVSDSDDEDDEGPVRRRPVKKTAAKRTYDNDKGAPSVNKSRRRTILDEDDEEDEDIPPRRIVRRTSPAKVPAKKVMRRR